jgi:hypothetical protein
MEAEFFHLFPGFSRRPFLVCHTIGGDHHSGAVVAIAAMHEYFLVSIVAQ